MSLLVVAVPCAAFAALAYGVSTAAQYATVTASDATVRGVLTDPRWLAATGGDVVGTVAQVLALVYGPAVLVQPIVLLAVPVSLVAHRLTTSQRLRPDQVWASAVLVAAVVLMAVLARDARAPAAMSTTASIAATVTLIAGGGVLCAAVFPLAPPVRAVWWAGIGGVGFGIAGVLLNAATAGWSAGGHRLLAAQFAAPIIGAALIGAFGMVVLQTAFHWGELAATFTLSEASAPVAAVALGSWLVDERLPVSAAYLAGYAVSAALAVAGVLIVARASATAAASR